ncbi:MAG: L-aspartate oxidase [Lachnospiraceae bacterium]|nr:L-aspartate oxidase [Lachnospiraceae bacterium]
MIETDIFIVGTGCSGLYCALNLPRDKQILMITKSDVRSSDSYLAQGGICVLKDESDYDSYFEDTLKAGHYENNKESVDIMIRTSQEVISDLIGYGVDFEHTTDGELAYTREGGHSDKRILFHEDETGEEITHTLLNRVLELPNVTILERTALIDIIEENNTCYGGVIKKEDGTIDTVAFRDDMVLACGGIGGLYKHSTNFRHLTGDGIAIAVKHGIERQDIDYIQIHPTTLYSDKPQDRSFLISESVRGEGAVLLDKNMERFTDELQPRDVVTAAIRKQMKLDGTEFVWEDLRTIPKDVVENHFPNIVEHCKQRGFDVYTEPIPVVPAQHYFMGGIKVDHNSATTMNNLYAVGETACNGVHGVNRLASNSLLESLVFAKRAAHKINADAVGLNAVPEPNWGERQAIVNKLFKPEDYADLSQIENDYRQMVLDEIDKFKEERGK